MPKIWVLFDRYTTLFTTWPSVVLIIFLCVVRPIRNLINVFTCTINRVSELGFRDLSIILMNPNVPNEAKNNLTKRFVDTKNDFRNALNTLSCLNKTLRKIIISIKNSHLNHSNQKELTDTLVDSFETLLNIFRLHSDTFKEEIMVVETVIKSLLTKPESHLEINFPLCDALSKLDPEWGETDADDFKFLKNLREKLTKLLKD